jgi:hypothetical protein
MLGGWQETRVGLKEAVVGWHPCRSVRMGILKSAGNFSFRSSYEPHHCSRYTSMANSKEYPTAIWHERYYFQSGTDIFRVREPFIGAV